MKDRLIILRGPKNDQCKEENYNIEYWFKKLQKLCENTDMLPILVPYRVGIIDKDNIIDIEYIKNLESNKRQD